MIAYISRLFLALLVTVIIEFAVAWIFSLRGKDLAVVILVNVITNPLLNYLILVNAYFQLFPNAFGFGLFLEGCVIPAEWGLLVKYTRLSRRKTLLLSFTMNVVSFLVGLLIFRPGFDILNG